MRADQIVEVAVEFETKPGESSPGRYETQPTGKAFVVARLASPVGSWTWGEDDGSGELDQAQRMLVRCESEDAADAMAKRIVRNLIARAGQAAILSFTSNGAMTVEAVKPPPPDTSEEPESP
ncbi:hypothetical protein AB0M22_45075 [Nocardia sp. NPDC051756]|uniref:hypothetical protein n=1 Tax=Nocardia sp. NPDC051756 TaxID=3154751 RepID=UPI00342A7FFF